MKNRELSSATIANHDRIATRRNYIPTSISSFKRSLHAVTPLKPLACVLLFIYLFNTLVYYTLTFSWNVRTTACRRNWNRKLIRIVKGSVRRDSFHSTRREFLLENLAGNDKSLGLISETERKEIQSVSLSKINFVKRLLRFCRQRH